MEVSTEKKRRGRKSKIEETNQLNTDSNVIVDKVPKKRGRKPKGGKVVVCVSDTTNDIETVPNIILHLKCNKLDIDCTEFNTNIDTYQFTHNKLYDFNYLNISNNEPNYDINTNDNQNYINTNISSTNDTKLIWQKLEKLANSLHLDSVSDKKSSCFFSYLRI